jgi:hypothetical protein
MLHMTGFTASSITLCDMGDKSVNFLYCSAGIKAISFIYAALVMTNTVQDNYQF